MGRPAATEEWMRRNINDQLNITSVVVFTKYFISPIGDLLNGAKTLTSVNLVAKDDIM